MSRSQKTRNWTFLDRYNYYVPGVADMFILLAWLLAGALLGNVVSLLFLPLGEGAQEYAMLVSYPVMFLPAMIYAGHKSQVSSMDHSGVKVDGNAHFKPLGAALCAILVMIGTISAAFCTEPVNSLLPQMPEVLKNMLESLTGGTFWVNFLSVSIFAPLFEEWLCRGMILRGLLHSKVRPVWAIVISAAFFAIIHMNPWQAVPAFVFGCLFGYVYYRTGSLKLTMLMHFTNNTMSLILSNIDAFKDKDSFMDVMPAPAYWITFAAGILLLVLVIRAFRKIPLESEKGNSDVIPAIFDGE